jgi:hypothetical protein
VGFGFCGVEAGLGGVGEAFGGVLPIFVGVPDLDKLSLPDLGGVNLCESG